MYTWRPTSVLRCKTANDVDLCLFSGTEKDIYQLSLWQIMAKRIAASKAIDQEEAPAAFWHQNDWHLNLTNISRDQVNPQGVRKLPGHQAAFFRCYRPHTEWVCWGSFRAWSNRSWNKSFFPQVNWILLQCSSLEIPNSRGRGPQLWKLFFKKCILRTVATIPTLRNTLLYTCVFSNNYQAFLLFSR